MNWYVLIPFGVGVIVLIVFLIKRNLKDEQQFEKQLKDDYRKPKEDAGDINTEELPK